MPRISASLLVSLILSAPLATLAGTEVSWNHEVRPILADKCFSCHAADAKNRKGDLRLDTAEGATASGAVVPGDPLKSGIIQRIRSTDPEEVMPPPEKHLEVTAAEREILERWIREGAKFEKHWAFLPPRAEEAGSIDAFVDESLAKRGWKAAAPAEKAEWLRRVTLALTGIAPSLEELAAFEADTEDGARERVVDRLLASPRYGEHMAVSWLDAARYADTFGRHEDSDNGMWPWREWVIRAFNDNLPYDQFLTWQMAGDLLPAATQDQRLATAFHRLAVMTNEAGADPEENRWMQVFDRVRTTSETVLGLTMDCAQCHDHKYDPFTMRDYYRLAAFFDKGDEFGLFARYCNGVPPPSTFLYQDQQEKEHAALKEKVTSAEARWKAEKEAARPRFSEWLKQYAPPGRAPGLWESVSTAPVRMPSLLPDPQFHVTFDEFDTGKVLYVVSGPGGKPLRGPVSKKSNMKGVAGRALEFPELKASRFSLPADLAHFRRHSPFTFSLWLKTERTPERGVIFHRCRAGQDATHRGYELMFLDGRLTATLAHFYPGNAVRVQATEKLDFAEWRHIGVTYDGSSTAAGLKIYVDGAPLALQVLRDHLYRDIDYLPEWLDRENTQVADGADRVLALTLGGRTLDTGLSGAGIDELRAWDRELSPVELKMISGQPVTEQDDAWFDWYAREVDSPAREALAALHAAREAENLFNVKLREVMVMADSPQAARETPMLMRGDFRNPAEKVTPGTPEALLAFPEDAPRNRLGLAQWLTHPEHPLTARVQVNRLWTNFFGRGLVPTPEDFGIQGRPPTHPALLDWLAVRFVRSGWNMKALCREIALSAAFGRSSLPADAAQLADDPQNIHLARGPRLRLTGEMLRDSALAASRLLVPQAGGPSVKPYQPEGLWEDSGTQHEYVQDKGDALYRRSLYTFWRRTCAPPVMNVFDAPTREFCLVKRASTMTPLQPLALLNDTAFLEAARVIAEQLVTDFPAPVQDMQRAEKAFRLLTSRAPSAVQLKSLVALAMETRVEAKADPAAVQKLLAATGEKPRNAALPPEEVAAAFLLVRTVMNCEPCLVAY